MNYKNSTDIYHLRDQITNIDLLLQKERVEKQSLGVIIQELEKKIESMQLQIDNERKEKRELYDNNNELKMMNVLLNTNISLLEKEKNRHLEANAMVFQIFIFRIKITLG